MYCFSTPPRKINLRARYDNGANGANGGYVYRGHDNGGNGNGRSNGYKNDNGYRIGAQIGVLDADLRAEDALLKEIRKETPTLRGLLPDNVVGHDDARENEWRRRKEEWAKGGESSTPCRRCNFAGKCCIGSGPPCDGPPDAGGTKAIEEYCDHDCECASGGCGRKSAAAGRTTTCCKSGESTWYGGYLYCKGMPKGYTCWSDEMCGSGYCKGNWYGTKKGKCS